MIMFESSNAYVVVSLEGRSLRAVACTQEQSWTRCAAIMKSGDLLVVREVRDANEAERLANDIDEMEFVDATRAQILAWAERAFDANDDIHDSGYEVDDSDGDGDILAGV